MLVWKRRSETVCIPGLRYCVAHKTVFVSYPRPQGLLSMETEILSDFGLARPALGPTQPPIQWVTGALSLRVKRPGCEADHTPQSTAEVKE
jgi:hypothetical protein